MNQGHSRKEKILKRSDFIRVYRQGKRIGTEHFVIYVAPGQGEGHSRLGISAGRRVGSAVRRNRIKRLIREYFRINKWEILPKDAKSGWDVVVDVRHACPHLKLDNVAREFQECCQKLPSG